MRKSAVVLLSGGQDSTTALYWAKRRFDEVHAFSVDYGQRHKIELQQAAKIAELAGVPHQVISIGTAFVDIADSDLVRSGTGFTERPDGLPSSFVPGRNILLMSIAGAIAKKLDADAIVTGVCEEDYSGYPDCRRLFITDMQCALRTGLEMIFLEIETPLMHLSKAATWELAHELGEDCMNAVLELSHTCYNGDRSVRHAWGYGCGECPSCKIRAKGFAEWSEA